MHLNPAALHRYIQLALGIAVQFGGQQVGATGENGQSGFAQFKDIGHHAIDHDGPGASRFSCTGCHRTDTGVMSITVHVNHQHVAVLKACQGAVDGNGIGVDHAQRHGTTYNFDGAQHGANFGTDKAVFEQMPEGGEADLMEFFKQLSRGVHGLPLLC
ncbi:hypothetical protein D3C84_253190 [compost metagenome]